MQTGIIKCKNREEWLEARKPTIGASDAAVLFGPEVCMYKGQTELRLYADKTGQLRDEDTSQKPWVIAGHKLEQAVADWWWGEYGEKMFDKMVNPGEFTIYRHDNGVQHATPDFLLYKDDEVVATLQIKNVGYHMRQHWADEMTPIGVQCQCQQEMACVGVGRSFVAALIGGQDFFQQEIRENPAFQRTLANKCKAFMRRVQEGSPPDPTHADLDLLASMFPECRVGISIELDPDVDEHLEILQHVQWHDKIKQQIKDCEGGLNYHEAMVKAFMKDAEMLILPDGSAVKWKHQKRKETIVKAHTRRPFTRSKA